MKQAFGLIGQTFLAAHTDVASFINTFGIKNFFQSGQHFFLEILHSERVDLNNQDVVVTIDNEAGESVTFSEHQTIGVCLLRIDERFAQFFQSP